MKRFLALITAIIPFVSWAQLPTDFRSEQVAMALRDYSLMQGDTLMVEGQVACLAADRFLPYSNYVYVECISADDSVLVRHKVSCKDGGRFALRLPVSYDWAAGTYYLRGYTRLMMNFSEESFCVQPFLVGRKFGMRDDDASDLRCIMSVVGGRLMGGCMQRVAIGVENVFGFPVSAELDLKDDKDNTVAVVRTSKSGLAMLNFIPQTGSRYFLTTQNGANRFALPDVVSGGLQLQGDMKGTRIRYQINGDLADGDYRMCTYDRLNGVQQYAIGGKAAGLIQLSSAPEVASLFLIDAEGNVASEATLSAPEASYIADIVVKDSIRVGETLNYSLAQTDSKAQIVTRLVADNVPIVPMEAELKYLSDYRSDLPFPSESYTQGYEQRREDLHTWLSSARFKRFDIAKALREGEKIYRYMPEENITFAGRVNFNNGKPLDGGTILAYNTETNNVYDADIDTQGRFRMAVDDFCEGTNFYIEAKSAKGKEDFYKYVLDSDTFPDVHSIAMQQTADWQESTAVEMKKGVKLGFNDSKYFSLPGVEVKARVQSPYNVPTNKFYSTNYVDREEIEKKDYHTLLQILQRMPGLRVCRTSDGTKGSEHWEIKTSRGESSFVNNNVLILLDGMRMDSEELVDNLMETAAFEIESVELLQAWQTNAVAFGAINGCVYIKTRNATRDKKDVRTKGIYYSPIGTVPQNGSKATTSGLKANEKGKMRLCVDIVGAASARSAIFPVNIME